MYAQTAEDKEDWMQAIRYKWHFCFLPVLLLALQLVMCVFASTRVTSVLLAAFMVNYLVNVKQLDKKIYSAFEVNVLFCFSA